MKYLPVRPDPTLSMVTNVTLGVQKKHDHIAVPEKLYDAFVTDPPRNLLSLVNQIIYFPSAFIEQGLILHKLGWQLEALHTATRQLIYEFSDQFPIDIVNELLQEQASNLNNTNNGSLGAVYPNI